MIRHNNNSKGFLIVFFTIIFSFIIIFLIIASYNFKFKHFEEINDKNLLILKYQLNKINNSSYDTIFLGDSSLGNAINFNFVNANTKSKSINLALTKIYGFSGIYNLLVNAHKKNPKKLKNIIIMIGYDFLDNDFESESFFLTSRSFFSFISFSKIPDWIYFNFKYFFKSLKRNNDKKNIYYNNFLKDMIHNDYVKQDIRNELKFKESMKIKKYLEYKVNLFKKINSYSISNNLNLILINGPIHNDVFLNNRDNIDKFDSLFDKYGSIYFDERIVLSDEKIGDMPMHIKYEYKDIITKDYLNIILKHFK